MNYFANNVAHIHETPFYFRCPSALSEKMESVKKIYQGSKAWNLGSNPMSDIGLYTTGEIKKLMNISEFDEIKDGILQVKSDPAVKESVRFNFVFFYSV